MLKRNETQRNVGLKNNSTKLCKRLFQNVSKKTAIWKLDYSFSMTLYPVFWFAVLSNSWFFLTLLTFWNWTDVLEDLWCAALLFVCCSSTVTNMVIWTNSPTISFQGLGGKWPQNFDAYGDKNAKFKIIPASLLTADDGCLTRYSLCCSFLFQHN